MRYLTASRAVKGVYIFGGIWFAVMPFAVLFVVLHLRWAPVMLLYHVFGGKEVLMQLQSVGSMWFWIVFTLDWALMSADALQAGCAIAIFTMPCSTPIP